jgi:hypothetical protein
MRERDITSIGDIYGKMLNTVRTIKESKAPKTFDGEFRSKKRKDGPESADGYNKAENKKAGEYNEEEDEEDDDVSKYLPKSKMEKSSNKLKEKLKNPNITDKDKKIITKSLKNLESGMENSESEEIQESKKIATKILNKHMSKSAFDTLFNKVLKENFGQSQEGDDLDALGLDDSTPDADMGDDFGGDEDFGGEEDSVTFTLDRATAEKLLDVIGAAMPPMEDDDSDDDSDDEFGGEDDDLDFGDEGDDDMEMDFEEDEE